MASEERGSEKGWRGQPIKIKMSLLCTRGSVSPPPRDFRETVGDSGCPTRREREPGQLSSVIG